MIHSRMLLFNVGSSELLILALIVLLILCGCKIPELMKALGKGGRIFRQRTSKTESDSKRRQDEATGSRQHGRPGRQE